MMERARKRERISARRAAIRELIKISVEILRELGLSASAIRYYRDAGKRAGMLPHEIVRRMADEIARRMQEEQGMLPHQAVRQVAEGAAWRHLQCGLKPYRPKGDAPEIGRN